MSPAVRPVRAFFPKAGEPARRDPMKPEQITDALEQAAAQMGVRVRYEAMTGDSAGAGGLCKIRGEWTVIMDRKATPSDRAAMLVEALSEFDVDAVYLPPEIRQVLIKRRAATRSGVANDIPSVETLPSGDGAALNHRS